MGNSNSREQQSTNQEQQQSWSDSFVGFFVGNNVEDKKENVAIVTATPPLSPTDVHIQTDYDENYEDDNKFYFEDFNDDELTDSETDMKAVLVDKESARHIFLGLDRKEKGYLSNTDVVLCLMQWNTDFGFEIEDKHYFEVI